MAKMLLKSGDAPWLAHVGQYHPSGLIHCSRDYHQKYSVDHVVECSEISAHGLENEICPVKTGTERLLVSGQNRGLI